MTPEKPPSGLIDTMAALVPILSAAMIGTAMRWGADRLKGRRWSIERIVIEGISVIGFAIMSWGLADWIGGSNRVAASIAAVTCWLGPKVVIGVVERRVAALREPTK